MSIEQGNSRPLFSIIIPARNEAEYLPKCLASIRIAQQEFSKITDSNIQDTYLLEVIVVLNRCTDNTEQIATSAGCTVTHNDSKNLAMIRNSGATLAQGEILVTIDADSTMSANMLCEIYRVLNRGDVVGGGVKIKPERVSLGIFVSVLFLLPLVLWHKVAGGLFFCRKEDFDAIGGFNSEYCSVEDIDFAKRLRKHGKKYGKRFIMLWRAHIVTSCRKFDRLGDWYFVRNPLRFWVLLQGKDQVEANKVWYDFER